MMGLFDLNIVTNNLVFLAECGLFNTDDQGIHVIGNITSGLIFAIQVFVPFALIIMGMTDMGKAVIQQKEDDIKKAQNIFVKRVVAAALTFLIITAVKLLISVLSRSDALSNQDSISECFEFFINGPGR